jgi:hypothetical protein
MIVAGYENIGIAGIRQKKERLVVRIAADAQPRADDAGGHDRHPRDRVLSGRSGT